MLFARTRNQFKTCVLQPTGAAFFWVSTVLMGWADTSDDDSDDYDPLQGRTQEQIDSLIFNFDEVVETIAIYASLMSVLVILAALAFSMRLIQWTLFLVLTMASLAWFAFYEQYMTGQFWIGLDIGVSPLFLIGIVLTSLHFIQAGFALSDQRAMRSLRVGFFGFALVPWIALLFYWLPEKPDMPMAFSILAGLAYLSHTATIPSFSGSVFFRRRNYGAITFAALVVIIASLGELDEGFDVSFSVLLIFVAIVGLSTLLLVQQVIAILRERDASIRQSLAAARREAQQSQELLALERDYSRAREVARKHTMRLATASHDIRQPIVSLRATMAAVTQEQPVEVKNQLKAAFDYLDGLAASYLETEEAENAPTRDAEVVADGHEVVSSQMLCDTLARMFRKEAEQRGLTFGAMAQDIQLRVQPLVITRILSNLLSNAIKHTPSGSVAIKGVGVDSGYTFGVQNSAALPENFKESDLVAPYVKGEASQGHGLGLSIAQQLASKHQMHLGWSSDPKDGTIFNLTIPLNDE